MNPDDDSPVDLGTKPEIESLVHDLMYHLVQSLSLQEMTLGQLFIKDAEQVGSEVFDAYIRAGVLTTEDYPAFKACYRQALLVGVGKANSLTEEWS